MNPVESVFLSVPPDFRCGYAAIIGAPNVGKSTFLNSVLGTKLSIVTPKPQTTRKKIMGLYHDERCQIIFLDTPGLLEPRYMMQAAMMEAAGDAITDANVLVYITDAKKAEDDGNDERAFERIKTAGKPAIALFNKIDRAEAAGYLTELKAKFEKTGLFVGAYSISALKGKGVREAVQAIAALMPEHPPLFPDDIISDESTRFFASEFIREQIFQLYKEEIPYASEVVIVEYKEKDGLDYIAADIMVERESQRKIMIGTKGEGIRTLGTRARKSIEAFIGRKVFLELHVKIRKGWRNDKAWLKRLGFPTSTVGK